jgi:hypothetical protein
MQYEDVCKLCIVHLPLSQLNFPNKRYSFVTRVDVGTTALHAATENERLVTYVTLQYADCVDVTGKEAVPSVSACPHSCYSCWSTSQLYWSLSYPHTTVYRHFLCFYQSWECLQFGSDKPAWRQAPVSVAAGLLGRSLPGAAVCVVARNGNWMWRGGCISHPALVLRLRTSNTFANLPPLLNLPSLIFGLAPFGWLLAVTLTSHFW